MTENYYPEITFCPIGGLVSEAQIKVNDNLFFEIPTRKTIENILGKNHKSLNLILSETRNLVIYSEPEPKLFGTFVVNYRNNSRDTYNQPRKWLKALRIWSKRPLISNGYHMIHLQREGSTSMSFEGASLDRPQINLEEYFSIQKLLKDDIPHIKAMVDQYPGGETELLKRIEKSISYLALSSNRLHETEQALINLWIAMECLHPIKAATKHRYALRTALLIGETDKEISDIYKKMIKEYDFRNRLVHGSKKVPHKKDLLKSISNLYQYTTRTIKRLIGYASWAQKNKNKDQETGDNLDMLLIQQSKRKEIMENTKWPLFANGD